MDNLKMQGHLTRGSVYYVVPSEAHPSVGHEQRSGRPAIIVSADVNNARSDLVEVVYLTTKKKRPRATHVPIMATGLASTALCEQISTVDKSRITNYCGQCTREELSAVDAALMISLGLSEFPMDDAPRPVAEQQMEPSPDADADINALLYEDETQHWIETLQSEAQTLREQNLAVTAKLELLQALYDNLLRSTIH